MAGKIDWTLNASRVHVGRVGDLELFYIGKGKAPFDAPGEMRLHVKFPSSASAPDGVTVASAEAGKEYAEELLKEFARKLARGMK